MKILFLSLDYPNKYRASFEFVKNLVEALADRGNHCYVIAPYSVTHEKRFWRGLEFEQREKGGTITISRPNYISFSNWKFCNHSLTDISRRNAIKRALRKMDFKPDVAYGHFWPCGFELYEYSHMHRIPLFVATGESVIEKFFNLSSRTEPFCEYLSGVICVSSKNKDESISLGLTSENKCFLSPNSINNNLFKLLDKTQCRKELNIPLGCFVIVFLGWFKQSKGPSRVAAAVESITTGAPVYSMFLGAGTEDNPECKNILIKKRLKHDEVPLYLNAADVFVLPTLHEGCCNAIVEAMACGLPVISSNLPFNWDILNENNSLMIDPNSIEDIAKAIVTLRDDNSLRKKLSEGALLTANELTIDKRAERIESFIKSKIKEVN